MPAKLIQWRGPGGLMPLFSTTGFPSLDDPAVRLSERTRNLLDAAWSEATEVPSWIPALDVSEDKNAYIVTAELPGMSPKDVTIDFSDGMLTIQGEKIEEKKEKKDDKKFHRWERRYGSFQRVLPFPGGVDEKNISAEFKDGVLTVRLPKHAEEKALRRQIPIVQK